jgi:sorting nexin-1/2
MEEFTGDEASTNNQIFPEQSAQPVEVEPIASSSIPSYSPDSHIPTAEELSNEWQIGISEPQKAGEGVMGTYMVYTVTIKTTNSNFRTTEWSVERRYSDFEWLRVKLCSAFRGTIVPPMPEKAPLNRFDSDLLMYRRKELERFLKRVLNQPLFLANEDLRTFLEASEAVLMQAKSQKGGSANAGEGKKSFFSGLMDKVTSVQQSLGTANEVDEWFDQQRRYWQTIENNIGLLLSRASAISKRHRELGQSWVELANITTTLASNESPTDELLSSYYQKLAEITNQLSSLETELSENQSSYFEDSLKDWIRVINAAHEVLDNRLADLLAYQNATKTREAKQEKLNKNPANANAQQELNDAEARETTCRNQFELISKTARDELDGLLKVKSQELTVAVRRLVQNSMNYHVTAASLWKEILSSIEDQPAE